MKAHRAILIRLPRDRCNVDYIKRLTALTSLAYRGFEVWVPDLPKPYNIKSIASKISREA
jgi:hypothetical protein